MTDIPGITLVCFGLVGTLVADEGVIELAFAEAIATQGVVTGTSAFARSMAQVHRARGQSPADVLGGLFPDNTARAQAAQLAFERSLAGAVGRTALKPIPQAQEILTWLADAGCRVAILTNLPRRELTAMLRAVGWRDVVNVALTADDVPRGCPFPDLALAAMLRVGVDDVREVAMVHGTGAGIECGRRAGVSVAAGVLTGPHAAARLRAAGATHVLRSVAELPAALAADSVGSLVPPQVPLERRSSEEARP